MQNEEAASERRLILSAADSSVYCTDLSLEINEVMTLCCAAVASFTLRGASPRWPCAHRFAALTFALTFMRVLLPRAGHGLIIQPLCWDECNLGKSWAVTVFSIWPSIGEGSQLNNVPTQASKSLGAETTFMHIYVSINWMTEPGKRSNLTSVCFFPTRGQELFSVDLEATETKCMNNVQSVLFFAATHL